VTQALRWLGPRVAEPGWLDALGSQPAPPGPGAAAAPPQSLEERSVRRGVRAPLREPAWLREPARRPLAGNQARGLPPAYVGSALRWLPGAGPACVRHS
jgi:hypothetical protein